MAVAARGWQQQRWGSRFGAHWCTDKVALPVDTQRYDGGESAAHRQAGQHEAGK